MFFTASYSVIKNRITTTGEVDPIDVRYIYSLKRGELLGDRISLFVFLQIIYQLNYYNFLFFRINSLYNEYIYNSTIPGSIHKLFKK